MNLDQRLEALTQSLELMAHMQRDAERKHDALAAEHQSHVAETDTRLNRITASVEETTVVVRNISDVLDTFNRAMATAIVEHERRIRKLE